MLAWAESLMYIFREYLGENKLLKENILTFLSGAQMGSIHEKISKKYRDTATLKERSLSISVLVIQKPHFLNSFICGGIQIQIKILQRKTIGMTVCAWLYSTAGDVLVRKM